MAMQPEDNSMSPLKMRLGEFLNKELARGKINLTRLAKETNVPKTCLHSWGAGVSPRLNEKNLLYLHRLSKYFNVPIQKILFGAFEHNLKEEVLYEGVFMEGKNKFRLTIHKLKD